MPEKNLNLAKKGKLFLIVGPSGVGKGVLVKQLRKLHPDFFFPPSVTTREPRAGERDGEQYYFLSADRFERLEQEGEFLETAVVHNTQKYGILKKPILEAIKANCVVVREVDIQGLISVQEKLPKEMFSAVFIVPPDMETLKKRILKRQPEMDPKELNQRLASAEKELDQKNLADYEIVSEEGKINEMVIEFTKIINQETSI